MIKLIIFDYDGVIVDSFSNVYEVHKIICKKLGVNHPKTIEEFRRLYGYTFIECYKNLGIKPEQHEKASQIFKQEIIKKKPDIFNGFKEVLKELSKKYKLVLVSSSFEEEVIQKLKKFNIFNYFSDIMTKISYRTDHFNKAKAIKDMIKKFNVEKEEAILIGDRDIDYDSGKEAGLINIILVDYGWGYSKEKIKQGFLIKKPIDILDAIKRIEESS